MRRFKFENLFFPFSACCILCCGTVGNLILYEKYNLNKLWNVESILFDCPFFFIIIILNLTKMWLTRLVSSFTGKEEYTHALFSFFLNTFAQTCTFRYPYSLNARIIILLIIFDTSWFRNHEITEEPKVSVQRAVTVSTQHRSHIGIPPANRGREIHMVTNQASGLESLCSPASHHSDVAIDLWRWTSCRGKRDLKVTSQH